MKWPRALCLALGMTVAAANAHAGDSDSALQAARKSAEAAPRAPAFPRGAFMRNASVRDVSLSPDGQWLAFRRDKGNRLTLWLREIASGEEQRVLADSEDTGMHWSGDGARLWLPDTQGISVFDMASRTGRRIFRYDESRQQAFWQVDRNAPDFAVLHEKVPAAGEWLYRYLAIDADGMTRVIGESRKTLSHVLLDEEGGIRYSSGYDGAAFDTVIWKYDGSELRELMRCPLPQQCRPIAFAGDTVWALAHNGEDLVSLQRLDGDAGAWRTLQTDPRGVADAVAVLMQADGKDWFAAAYRPDRVAWHGRTADADAALARLQALLPHANLNISAANDGRRWLVQATKSGWHHDRYFLFDVAGRSLQELFAAERQQDLPESNLAGMQPVQWRGKDGMALHGYVFLPTGIPLETAPIVALIHGGPYARAHGEGDAGTQLLVNRGYIVFAPNFRASTGYGVKYATAARGEFGKTGVLDDIVTGLDHLLANGIGDATRQAVVGHSFGGYASLLAVTHYPQRFAFAVASAAPVDMGWTMTDIAIEGGSALSADGPPIATLLPRYGVPYADPAWHDTMQRESPLAHAAELHTPVYLWAGGADDRVAVESVVRYAADASAGLRPALLVDPESGHSPHDRLNAEALAWLIENAANEQFGGGVTPPTAALQAFIGEHLRPGAVARAH